VKLKTYVIGRSPFADVVLADASVASHHAELVATDDGRFYVTDCGTATGTWRRGGRADAGENPIWEPVRQTFVGGDESIRLGEYLCTVKGLLGGTGERHREHGRGEALYDDRTERLRGRVERDSRTGEIVRKRP
jgi:pSer/pThr/pTyr-binding forkhead associated (FHA) protein